MRVAAILYLYLYLFLSLVLIKCVLGGDVEVGVKEGECKAGTAGCKSTEDNGTGSVPSVSDEGVDGGYVEPELGPNIKRAERAVVNDDPEEAWGEWGETAQSRRNPMPRRQRGIEPGMGIESVLGSVMRQEKVLYAYLKPAVATSEKIGRALTTRFFTMLNGGGVACQTWYVHSVGSSQRQIVLKCETVRDGHMAKNFLVTQAEIERVNLDNLDFTPKPEPDDDDDDDDDDISDKVAGVAGAGTTGGKQEL